MILRASWWEKPSEGFGGELEKHAPKFRYHGPCIIVLGKTKFSVRELKNKYDPPHRYECVKNLVAQGKTHALHFFGLREQSGGNFEPSHMRGLQA